MVFNKVAIVEVVTFAFVICALADVKPLDKFKEALETFVETEFVAVILVA